MDAFVFYTAGIVALVASVLVVTRKNPVYSSIFLVLFFGTVSVQFLALRAPFLAVIQLLVYAGAIMVLFLFVLMLLNLTPEELRENVTRRRRAGAGIASAALFLLLSSAILRSPKISRAPDLAGPVPPGPLETAGETRALAESLFSRHALAFELTSFLIMIAVIGAIYLTKSRAASGARSADSAREPEPAAPPRTPPAPPVAEPSDRREEEGDAVLAGGQEGRP